MAVCVCVCVCVCARACVCVCVRVCVCVCHAHTVGLYWPLCRWSFGVVLWEIVTMGELFCSTEQMKGVCMYVLHLWQPVI